MESAARRKMAMCSAGGTPTRQCEQIMVAAEAVFTWLRRRQTTMDDIGRRLGYSSPTVYRYFG